MPVTLIQNHLWTIRAPAPCLKIGTMPFLFICSKEVLDGHLFFILKKLKLVIITPEDLCSNHLRSLCFCAHCSLFNYFKNISFLTDSHPLTPLRRSLLSTVITNTGYKIKFISVFRSCCSSVSFGRYVQVSIFCDKYYTGHSLSFSVIIFASFCMLL